MRNLRKFFAVFVAVAMLLTAVAPAFAADAADTADTAAAMSDAKAVETLGMLKGDGKGITDAYLKTSVTRLQAAIMFLRLKGLEAKAIAFTGKENFADASKVDWAEGKAILGYLKANKDLGWQGDGTNFNPNNEISAQEYYKILLVSLGYEEEKDFKFADTIKFAESKGLKAAAAAKPFTVNDVAIATVEALKATVKAGGKTLAATLVETKVLDQKKVDEAFASAGPAAGDFVVAAKASALTVTFGTAVADTAKVAFTISRDAAEIPVKLTAKWDNAKKVATLTSASKLVEGDYKVAVKNDTKDLGSKALKIEKEKIAKIEVLSDMLIRISDTAGKVSYKVTNQYGEDITNSTMSESINWTSSIGSGSVTADAKNGKLKVTKEGAVLNQLKDQKVVVVTGIDYDNGASVTKSLTVSDTVGGIAEIKLIGIKDKKEITTATTDVLYIDYEAKDAYGNAINDWDTLTNEDAFLLKSSNTNIANVSVERDPSNDKNAVFKLTNSTSNTGITVIYATAVSSGKTATLQIEVKEAATVAQFQLQLPPEDVAEKEVVEIPFTALDQNGKVITDYETIFNRINSDKITLSVSKGTVAESFQYQRASDGTFKLYYQAPAIASGNKSEKIMITATAKTEMTVKMSQINIDVKERAYPKNITEVGSAYTRYMLAGSDTSGKSNQFTVLDQYGRKVDMYNNYAIGNDRYYVTAVSNNTAAVYVDSTLYVAMADNDAWKIKLIAGTTTGSADVSFKLMKTSYNPTAKTWSAPEEKDSKTVTIFNVDKKDVVSYVVKPAANVYYANNMTNSALTAIGSSNPAKYWNADGSGITAAQKEYKQDANGVKGKLASGAEVEIPDASIVSRIVDDPYNRFQFGKSDAFNMLAQNNSLKDEDDFTAKLTVTVLGYNNVAYSASCELKGSRVQPAAKSIAIGTPRGGSPDAAKAGAKQGQWAWDWKYYNYAEKIGDTYLLEKRNAGQQFNPTAVTTDVYKTAKTMAKFTVLETPAGEYGQSQRAAVHFGLPDQYGKSVIPPAMIQITKAVDINGAAISKISNPVITEDSAKTTDWAFYLNSGATIEVGDQFTILCVAENGVAPKTVTIKIVADKQGAGMETVLP